MIAYSIILFVCLFVCATVRMPAQCAYRSQKGWKQGQKLFKKESNVRMLAAHW